MKFWSGNNVDLDMLKTFTDQHSAGRLSDEEFRALACDAVETIIARNLELFSAQEGFRDLVVKAPRWRMTKNNSQTPEVTI